MTRLGRKNIFTLFMKQNGTVTTNKNSFYILIKFAHACKRYIHALVFWVYFHFVFNCSYLILYLVVLQWFYCLCGYWIYLVDRNATLSSHSFKFRTVKTNKQLKRGLYLFAYYLLFEMSTPLPYLNKNIYLFIIFVYLLINDRVAKWIFLFLYHLLEMKKHKCSCCYF